MECNKEEAIRAKEVAESKMLNKDFSAARKIALKAQRLHEDLENISQMLLVCDVHCVAEQKLFGTEMDWYGILKVESTVDEVTIKKQYRKLALQLHPDKNKFPGAEAAFKLIGEAQRLLLDRQKRHVHDVKRKSHTNKPATHYRPPQPQRKPPNPTFGVQNSFNRNFTNVNFQHPAHPAAKPGFSNGRPTFWTACPFCSVKFQFHIEVLNKSIICQSCNRPFVAFERSPDASTQPVFPQKKDVPNKSAHKVEPGQKERATIGQSNAEFSQKKGSSSEFVSKNVNRKKRKKQESDSSESSTSDSSSDESEEDIIIEKDGEFKAAANFGSSSERPRRSVRCKQNVSYKENVSDDEEEDYEIPSEKIKRSRSSFSAEYVNGFKDDEQQGIDSNLKPQNVKGKEKLEENGSEEDSEFVADTKPESKLDPENYEYPDPEFKDFDKDKRKECFKVGQIWACYDTLDAMPRFYALIKKVFSPGFKLKFTWLEAHPDDRDKREWVKEGLPASTGKFIHGGSEDAKDVKIFSHEMCWEKGGEKNLVKILPQKDEVWALFKNWDINWKSDASNHRGEYEYEFVEVLSDYAEDVGISVTYLGKVRGFVSLFCRISGRARDRFLIKPDELYRFSHKVPSFRLQGNEKDSVPKGSLELDSAALPRNIEEISAPKVPYAFAGDTGPEFFDLSSPDSSGQENTTS